MGTRGREHTWIGALVDVSTQGWEHTGTGALVDGSTWYCALQKHRKTNTCLTCVPRCSRTTQETMMSTSRWLHGKLLPRGESLTRGLGLAGYHDLRQPEKGPTLPSKHLKSCHCLFPFFCRLPSNLDSEWFPPEIFSQLSGPQLKYRTPSSGLHFPRLPRFPHSQIPQSCFTEVFGLSGKTHPSWPEPLIAPASVTLAIWGNFAL